MRKKIKPWVEQNEERINSFCTRDYYGYVITHIDIPTD